MARIPDTELERIKREVDLVGLVKRSGVTLEAKGRNWMGRCPWHEDRTPSLVITPSKGLWHCLGACRVGGTAIDWMMKSEGVSFRHAVQLLREGISPRVVSEDAPKHSTVRRLASPVSPETDDERELLDQVLSYYQEQLREEGSAALAYLERRGIADPEAVERFRLGYADRTLGLRLPEKNRKAGREIRSRLAKLGILRQSGHEHLSGSLVIPILGTEGEVLNLYGRKIGDHLRKGTAYHLYLPRPQRGVWNLAGLEGAEEVILCESLIDALSFWCAGFRQVTASYGTNGFTDFHHGALRRLGVRRVLIAYDADSAGNQAAEGLAERLGEEGIGCFRVRFPKGMDANAYACQVQPAQKALLTALRAAEWRSGPTQRSSPRSKPSPSPEPTEAPPCEPPPESLPVSPPLAAAPPRPQADTAPELPALGTPIDLRFGDREYRIRGWEKNLSYERLKVLIRVSVGELFYLDTVDLVSARQRSRFLKEATSELGLELESTKRDLAKVLHHLEELQEVLIQQTLEPKEKAAPVLTPEEETEALELLRDPRLLVRLLEDLDACGLVGEETNKLTGILATVSRKLNEPLAILLQSSSAAGKSALMEGILKLVPEEDRVQYSAMTGQSLYYMGEADLRHKVLAVIEEEGAQQASYALKLLQSEGELTIASTGKDPNTGKLLTHEYRVEGPVMLFLTTTSIEIDEELLNRCLVLSVDENREQTRAIHRLQRQSQTLEGLLRKEDRRRIWKRHRNAQRLLQPLLVANPYAEQLTFLDDRTRTRRDHLKYLTLIRTITLLHQYQRPRKRLEHRGQKLDVIEVAPPDIAAANLLAHRILGRTLDELPPQTRRLLERLDAYVTAEEKRLELERCEVRFRRRDIRELTGWSLTQVRLHLERLVELEYVLVHRGGRGQSFVYELLYRGEGRDGEPFALQLLDPKQLTKSAASRNHDYDLDLAGLEAHLAGPYRPQDAPMSGGWHTPERPSRSNGEEALVDSLLEDPEKALLEKKGNGSSYSHPGVGVS